MEQKKRSGSRTGSRTAYMTVEASLILPIAVLLCAFLMILSFYLYTLCFLNQAAYLAAFRASLAAGESAEGRRAVAEEAAERLLEQRILPIRDLEKEFEASGLSVRVCFSAQLALPVLEILPVEIGTLRIRAEKKAQIRDAAAYIRLMRRLAPGEGEE